MPSIVTSSTKIIVMAIVGTVCRFVMTSGQNSRLLSDFSTQMAPLSAQNNLIIMDDTVLVYCYCSSVVQMIPYHNDKL